VSPRELVEAAIARIEAVNPRLDAVIWTRFDAARLEAEGELPDGPTGTRTSWSAWPASSSRPHPGAGGTRRSTHHQYTHDKGAATIPASTESLVNMVNHVHIPAGFWQVAPPQ
jgi:hypothetical protein